MFTSDNYQSMIPGPNGACAPGIPNQAPLDTTTNSNAPNPGNSFTVRHNTSFHGLELSTPAGREGSRAEATTPTNNPVNPTQPSAVQLTPATCKHLQDVAARLWVIAHYQQYEPQSISSFDTQHGAMPHLGKVLLAQALSMLQWCLPCLCQIYDLAPQVCHTPALLTPCRRN